MLQNNRNKRDSELKCGKKFHTSNDTPPEKKPTWWITTSMHYLSYFV